MSGRLCGDQLARPQDLNHSMICNDPLGSQHLNWGSKQWEGGVRSLKPTVVIRLAAMATASLLACAGCACSPSTSGTLASAALNGASPPAATASAKVRCRFLDSFDLALASNVRGESTPRGALTHWITANRMPDYTDVAGPWLQTFTSVGQINFTAGHATVHVVPVSNERGWVVLSGRRC
jgi:hypothetical protein